jgi:hypothetical protein
VTAGYETAEISFYNINNLTTSQEMYIGRVLTDDLRALLASGTMTISEIAGALLLTLNQAAQLAEAISSTQAILDESANQYALSLLTCYWKSAPYTVSCPEGALGDSVTKEEGYAISYVSQEDADRKAQRDADREIRCVYCNEPFSVPCVIPEGADMTGIVVTGGKTYPAGFLCRSTPEELADAIELYKSFSPPCSFCNENEIRIECPPGAVGNPIVIPPLSRCFPDYESIRAFLDELINLEPLCIWPNIEVVCDCQDVAGSHPDASDSWSVTIPSGSVTGESQEDAQQQANELCQENLKCCFFNDRQVDGTCPSGYVAEPGVAAAREVISCDSKADANQIAMEMAMDRTRCGDIGDGGDGDPDPPEPPPPDVGAGGTCAAHIHGFEEVRAGVIGIVSQPVAFSLEAIPDGLNPDQPGEGGNGVDINLRCEIYPEGYYEVQKPIPNYRSPELMINIWGSDNCTLSTSTVSIGFEDGAFTTYEGGGGGTQFYCVSTED